VNDVTVMKLLEIANRKFHDLFRLGGESTERKPLYQEINGTLDGRG
jgi:hypothetical protein